MLPRVPIFPWRLIMVPSTNDPYFDFPPVADIETWSKILGCHPQSLRRAISAGNIKAVRLGRLIKVPRHSVIEWLHGDK
jgi:excisionase family DNA binding protein